MSEHHNLINNKQIAFDRLLSQKTSDFDSQNIEHLVAALITITPEAFKTAMDIIREDSLLQAKIADYMHKTALKTINSNDEMTNKVLDNGSANSAIIREIMKRPDLTFDQIEMCFAELRFYAQEMSEAQSKSQIVNERVFQQEQDNLKEISKDSAGKRSIATNFIVGLGGFALGAVLSPYIKKLLSNSR